MYGMLTTEEKVRRLWEHRNCSSVCEVDSLPNEGQEGQLIRSGGVLYMYDGNGWIPLNNVVIPFSLTDTVSRVDYYAQFPFIIDSINYGSPGEVTVYLNGAEYILGTLINVHDRIKITGDGFIAGHLAGYRTTAEFYDIKATVAVSRKEWTVSQTDNIIIGIINVGNAASTAPITIRLIKADPNFTYTPNTTDSSVTANGATYTVNNSSFTFSEQATRFNFTTASGVYLQPGEALWISVPTEAVGTVSSSSTFNVVLATNVNDLNGFNNSFISETATIV